MLLLAAEHNLGVSVVQIERIVWRPAMSAFKEAWPWNGNGPVVERRLQVLGTMSAEKNGLAQARRASVKTFPR